MTRRHPTQGTVEVEVDGTKYTGDYVVEGGGILTVSNPMLGLKRTHLVGGANPEVLARLLLKALAEQSKGKAKSEGKSESKRKSKSKGKSKR